MTDLVAGEPTTSATPGAHRGAAERGGLGGPADTASVAATRPTTSPPIDACLSSLAVGAGGSAQADPPLQLRDPREAEAFAKGAAMGFVRGFECALEQSRDRVEQITNYMKEKA